MLSILRRRRMSLIITSLLLGGFVGTATYLQDEQFATFSKIFPLSFSKASSSPVDAIKSQFGITDKTDYSVIYNISVLVKSKQLSTAIVRNRANHPKYRTLAHWLIDEYNKRTGLLQKKIKIPVTDTATLYIVGAGLLISNLDIVTDKTEFTKITTKAFDKKLAKQVNDAIIEELSDYHILVSTEKPRMELSKLRQIRDSLRSEMDSVESAIAGYQDASQFSVKYATGIPQSKLLRVRAEIEQLYATTATAYHNARFKLLSESPIFQVLDRAGEPFETIKPSWKKYGFIAFAGWAFIFSAFLIRKPVMRMMLDEMSKTKD